MLDKDYQNCFGTIQSDIVCLKNECVWKKECATEWEKSISESMNRIKKDTPVKSPNEN